MAALTTIATVATIASAGASIIGQRKQAKAARRSREAQEKAAKVANRQASLRRQRAVRQSLAQSRILRARAIAGGFSSGTPGASGVSGAAGAISTDAAVNVGASNQLFGLEQQRVGFLNQAAQFQTQGQSDAALFGGISQVTGLFGGQAGQQNLAALGLGQ